MNYVEELEKQNEELKQKLAQATDRRYIMEWNACYVEDYNSMYRLVHEMRVHGMRYATVLELKDSSDTNHKRYTCVFRCMGMSNDNFETLDECKSHIILKYNSHFMDESAA